MKTLLMTIAFMLSVTLTLNLNAQLKNPADALNKYSVDLYKTSKKKKENLFLSPLSTYMALLVTYEGADGKTQREFESVLHLDKNISTGNFSSLSKQLTKSIGKTNTLNITSALWLDTDFQVKESYNNKLSKLNIADTQTLDFSRKTSASNTINKWVSDRTNNKIKNIISPKDISKRSKMVISNAIYFNGEWSKKFDKTKTKPDTFYNIKKRESKVDFMNSKEQLQYYENKDFQFISKPYKKLLDKSFCIILPKNKYGIFDVENKLNNTLLDSVFSSTKREEVKLSMPKFKLEKSFTLTKNLKKLGLKSAFSRQANFKELTDQRPFFISCVKHKTFIDINEERTEAAAATTITGKLSTWKDPNKKPVVFKADHPYIFMIIDNKTKAIVFMGRYVMP